MKKLLFVLLSVLSFSSVAQLYTASGAIHSVRVHHMSEPTRNFLLLYVMHEFTNAGNCKVNSDGHVILNITDERMLQVAITAKASSLGVGVTVGFDDDYPDDDGNCALKWIEL